MDVLVILLTTLISSMATYAISHLLKRGGVIASAIVTLVSGMILPYFFPTMGLTLATAAACGSYAGMISLENAVDVFEMAAIGILVGILFVAAGNAFRVSAVVWARWEVLLVFPGSGLKVFSATKEK